jgi:hypothetical protein
MEATTFVEATTPVEEIASVTKSLGRRPRGGKAHQRRLKAIAASSEEMTNGATMTEETMAGVMMTAEKTITVAIMAHFAARDTLKAMTNFLDNNLDLVLPPRENAPPVPSSEDAPPVPSSEDAPPVPSSENAPPVPSSENAPPVFPGHGLEVIRKPRCTWLTSGNASGLVRALNFSPVCKLRNRSR